MTLYAKSNPVETLDEHTGRMLILWNELKQKSPQLFSEHGWDMLRYAIEIHDFGKVYDGFQYVIQSAIKKRDPSFAISDGLQPLAKIPHNCLSPAAIDENKLKSDGWTDEDIEFVASAVYFHHERRKIHEAIKNDKIPYKDEIKAALDGGFGTRVFEKFGFVPAKKFTGKKPMLFRKSMDKRALCREYLMLHGWLNRIDYAASAHLDTLEIPVEDRNGNTYYSLVRSSLLAYPKLRAVQEYASSHLGENLAFVAATGSGKTEAALLWGGDRKLFYTLPIRTAINAMYERIANKLGYENAALLHSDALSVYIDNDEDGDAFYSYTAAKQFCAPLTVCTVDQLFTFIFLGPGSELQLATLMNSLVVIDEIQSYSPEIIASLIHGLRTIKKYGGRFLIMTATLPKIIAEKEILPLLADGSDKKPVIPHFHTELDHRHRTELRLNADWADDALLAEIIEHGRTKRVLITVNTVNKAQQVYRSLKALAPKYLRLIHSRFIRSDRNRLEQEILAFAPNRKDRAPACGIWVATQVVEASLDVDFDILYTDMCAIESLLQRMGRVYRNRNNDADTVNVVVLDAGTGVRYVISQYMYVFSLNALKALTADGTRSVLLTESDALDLKERLMDLVYDPSLNKQIEEQYYSEIREKLNILRDAFAIPHSSADKTAFRDIDSMTVMPYGIYRELEDGGGFKCWEERLSSVCTDIERKRIYNEIYSNTVSVPNKSKKELGICMSEFMKRVCPDIYITYDNYDSEIGLNAGGNKNGDINVDDRML